MHNERIYKIHIAWLNNHNEAGLCLPEDVVNMSVCLLDINEQMYPVTTTLMATNQNHEIYDTSTCFARLHKYPEYDLRHLSACCYPRSEALIICFKSTSLENDAEDDLYLLMWIHAREGEHRSWYQILSGQVQP